MNLASGFATAAEELGQRPALVVGGQTYSYQALAARVGGIARVVADNTEDGAAVGVLAHRSEVAYAGILGALTAGRAYVPLHPKFPPHRTAAMVRGARLRFLIAGSEALESLRALLDHTETPCTVLLPDAADLPGWVEGSDHRFLSAGSLDGHQRSTTPASTAADDVAYIMFTSGSTGQPKGVPVTHGNAGAYVSYVCDRYDVAEHDRLSQAFDLTFDLSVHDMFVCWERGACLHTVPERAVMAPAKFIRDNALTMWFSVPSTVGRLVALRMLKPGSFPTLRASLFCGEALPSAYAREWQAAAPNSIVENLYGPTEATIAFTHYRWTGKASDSASVNGIVPIGWPFDGQRACVIDDALCPVADGSAGELCLAGSQVTRGYLDAPDLTDDRYVLLDGGDTRWYRTGDSVRKDADGCLHYLGRLDDQVKVRGFRVSLQEIEHVVREVSGASTAVAVAWPITYGSAEGIVAFVHEDCGMETDDLLLKCKDRLPEYMIPRRVCYVPSFPLNSNGKIDRRELQRSLEGVPT